MVAIELPGTGDRASRSTRPDMAVGHTENGVEGSKDFDVS